MLDVLTSLSAALAPLWEMSVTAAYAAAVVMALRLLLKKRAPRQVVCLLWLVVFARLLIPVSPESPLSIVPDVLAGQEQAVSAGSAPQAAAQVGGAVAGPVFQAGGAAAPAVPASPTFPTTAAPSGGVSSDPQSGPEAPFPWRALAAGVWLAGVVVMGGSGLLSYGRLRRRLFDAIRAGDGVWEHPDIDSPFILGILRPRIYLPTGLVGRPRKFILCHERSHLRRLDHIVKPVCWAALVLHWFNPMVWAAFLLMSRDIEAACDEAVLRRLGTQVKADYSTTLLALATGGRMPAPCPLAFDEGDAKGRIKNVLNYRRPTLWIILVSIVMAVLAAVCLLTNPMGDKAPQDDDPGPGSTVSQPPEEEPDSLLDPWMEEVLKGEREFLAPGGEPADIHRLGEAYGGDFDITLSRLAVMDLDKDGVNEMVLWPRVNGDDSIEAVSVPGYLILRRQGDTVCGYNPSFREFAYLKEDGSYYWSGSAFEGGIASMRFTPSGFESENISWCDNSVEEENYFVDGFRTTREGYLQAIYAQDHKSDASWYVYEGGRLWPAPLEAPFRPDSLESDRRPRALTREELDYFEQYFAMGDSRVPNIRSMLLVSEYGDPRDIDLYRLFYHGLTYVPDISQAELDALGWDGPGEKYKVTAAQMNQVLRAYLGLTLEETNRVGLDNFRYLPEYDAYYASHNDSEADSFVMNWGWFNEDGTISLIYESTLQNSGARMVTLEEAVQIYAHRLYYQVRSNTSAEDAQLPAAQPSPEPGVVISTAPSAAPEPTLSSAPSAAPAVCEHGLEDVRLEYVGSQLAAVCSQCGFTYLVPGATADNWDGRTGEGDGGGWVREHLDSDTDLEIAVFITSHETINAAMDGRIIILDVENGELVISTFYLRTLVDDFNQNSDYTLDFENKVMEVTYRGHTRQAQIEDGYWSYMRDHGGGFGPEIWPTDVWITTGLTCGFPIHNGRGLSLGIDAVWGITYSAENGIQAVSYF